MVTDAQNDKIITSLPGSGTGGNKGQQDVSPIAREELIYSHNFLLS